MKLNKIILILIFVLIFSFAIYIIGNVSYNINNQTVEENVSPEITEEDRLVFDKIANTPYDVENYNCMHKSLDFQHHMIEKGHVCFIKRILHSSGNYMHAFVLCNEAVFDPTSKPSFWNYDLKEYLRIMEKSGFKIDEMF